MIDPNGAHDTSACESADYNHYSMLGHVEDNFGLAPLGHAGDLVAPFGTGVKLNGCFGL